MIIYKSLINKINKEKLKLKIEAKKAVTEFDKILDKVLDDSLLGLWIINKDNIRIAYLNPFNKSIGCYNLAGNIIYIKSLKKIKTINHELFHTASTIVHEDMIRSGFAVYFKEGSIGVGLTEAYTEILVDRYIKTNDFKVYPLEKHFVSLLEEIVDKDNMEKYYFQTNLEELINHLQKYDSLRNIMDFITNLDTIFNNNYRKVTIDRIAHLNRLLLSWYIRKIDNEFNNNIMDRNTYLNKLDEFMKKVQTFDEDTLCSVDKLYCNIKKQTQK